MQQATLINTPTSVASKSTKRGSLTVDEALAAILNQINPIADFEKIKFNSGLGRILAKDVNATINVPPHDNSAMDGYAFSSDALSYGRVSLKVVGVALAGRAFKRRVRSDECVRIMTGAVIPDGCDSVIPHELVAVMNDIEIQFDSILLRAGVNCRQAGEDILQGARVLPAGKRLMPADIGLLASIGVDSIEVFRPLRVAFFSTGDELCSPGQQLKADCIYDSNRYTLQAMIQRLGFEGVDLGVIADDPQAIEQAISLGCEKADVIITAGGMSEGDADYSKALMPMLGEVKFCEVAMRPGRPMAFGMIYQGEKKSFLFGLPGNPVAAMVSFYLFVAPALTKIAGGNFFPTPLFKVLASENIKKRPGRTEYQRGIVETDEKGRQSVRITGMQGSGILRSMVEANCLIVLGHDQCDVNKGEFVNILSFEGLI